MISRREFIKKFFFIIDDLEVYTYKPLTKSTNFHDLLEKPRIYLTFRGFNDVSLINSQIRKIDLVSQTSSRLVVLVELNYLERIINNSGKLINETSLTPLKVKYILGFANKSWRLVDFISGL